MYDFCLVRQNSSLFQIFISSSAVFATEYKEFSLVNDIFEVDDQSIMPSSVVLFCILFYDPKFCEKHVLSELTTP